MSNREKDFELPLHPIGVVAERTGLSLDVLRVWERRYSVVEPTRDDAGRRLYTDGDIERLKLLAQATSGGRTIGQVASLPVEALRALVREDEAARWAANRPPEAQVEAERMVAEAMERARALDAQGLEALLRRAAAVLGTPTFLETVVAPLFRRIGEEWHAGRLSVPQEHLATGVAGPLVAQLGRALPVAPGAPGLVVATPAGDRHEVGALLVAAMAAVEGWRVTYLGADVPAADIARAALETGAGAVALSSVYLRDEDELTSELATLRRQLPSGVPVVVGGPGVAGLNGKADALDLVSLEDLTALRSYLRRGGRPEGSR